MFKCPNCEQLVSRHDIPCIQKHCLPHKFGVLRLLKRDFAKELFAFEAKFQTIRDFEGLRIKDTSIYERLPFIIDDEKYGWDEWKGCCEDLKIIRSFLKNQSSLNILNHGSWNGWLSNQLANMGHNVTAISYFIDEYDGLGANKFYKNDWTSIQMDIEDNLDVFQEKFDVIIVNRGISFLVNPVKTVNKLVQMLNPSGILIITGINYTRNKKCAKCSFEKYSKYIQDKYNFSVKLKPTKGYLSNNDLISLRKLGIKYKSYPGNRIKNLIKRLYAKKKRKYFGVFHKDRV